MLRTFVANPGLGGFGEKEAATPDAFCQIVKELVDNAVDACSSGVIGDDSTTNRRVRVVIEEYKEQADLLRVSVSDNGCGMKSIEDCVGAFHSSKQGTTHNDTTAASKTQPSNKNTDKPANRIESEDHTAGRYGIGLTLCLLHAQRLVPDSCASIQSATRDQTEWKVVQAVVETEHDTIRCIPGAQLKKSSRNESGTSIGVLLPGGDSAMEAWPRLAEYLARFKLSLGLTCSLEVLAPTLSRVPLFIKPSCTKSKEDAGTKQKAHEYKSEWRDGFSDDEDLGPTGDAQKHKGPKSKKKMHQKERNEVARDARKRDLCVAASQFLDRPVELTNVAFEVVPIHSQDQKTKRKRSLKGAPTLEVALIVHGPITSNEEDADDSLNEPVNEQGSVIDAQQEPPVDAKMTLVRIVNKIPLLDSAEAAACGLVQGLATKKRIWNSFGLDVTLDMEPISMCMAPTYDVRDSSQVESLIKRGVHELLDSSQKQKDDNGVETNDDNEDSKHFCMMPAKVRLGNILVIVQIHAKPSTLPLPTLSKGRLPANEKSIDTALDIGVSKCLQQLQENNPSLLLTGAGLRKAERDARYVPAIAEAMASVLLNRSVPDTERLSRLALWETNEGDSETSSSMSTEAVCRALEKRIRFVLEREEPICEKTVTDTASDEASSASESCPLSPIDIDWDVLQEETPDDPKAATAQSRNETDEEPSILNHPTPTYQDPRKLLYASSGEDSDGYEDW